MRRSGTPKTLDVFGCCPSQLLFARIRGHGATESNGVQRESCPTLQIGSRQLSPIAAAVTQSIRKPPTQAGGSSGRSPGSRPGLPGRVCRPPAEAMCRAEHHCHGELFPRKAERLSRGHWYGCNGRAQSAARRSFSAADVLTCEPAAGPGYAMLSTCRLLTD